jgi:hypothetical protein
VPNWAEVRLPTAMLCALPLASVRDVPSLLAITLRYGRRRLIRFSVSLLPVAQGAERNVIPRREFFLVSPSARRSDFIRGTRRAFAVSSGVIGRASGSAAAAASTPRF